MFWNKSESYLSIIVKAQIQVKVNQLGVFEFFQIFDKACCWIRNCKVGLKKIVERCVKMLEIKGCKIFNKCVIMLQMCKI